ncbi:MAG TPA: arsenite methyltransferase [Acidimicrobiia bacterium]|nr:arsenite methyltransferase [Acidimicrobiia bacterium]
MADHDADTIRTAVRERYAAAATATQASCCGDAAVEFGKGFGAALYDVGTTDTLPPAAVLASLGCGNPTALANLEAGQVVLDLGSGGGIDVLLSARRVGPTGYVYGLDMTPEMLELARRYQAEAGVTNAEFLYGTIEDIPLPDAAVDVIISNCVINLSADKTKVLAEAHRVLRPGGLFAVSDVVLLRPLSPQLTELRRLWTGCVAGALLDTEYRTKLAAVGFSDVDLEVTHVHERSRLASMASELELPAGFDVDAALDEIDGAIANAFIRARR